MRIAALIGGALALLTGPAFAQGLGGGQSTLWYYCEPTKAYYPYAPTCSVGWSQVLVDGPSRPPAPSERPPILAQAPTPPPAGGPSSGPPPQTEDARLFRREAELDNRCRSGTEDEPGTQRACDQRDKVISLLESRGWCWGADEQRSYKKTWHRCDEE